MQKEVFNLYFLWCQINVPVASLCNFKTNNNNDDVFLKTYHVCVLIFDLSRKQFQKKTF